MIALALHRERAGSAVTSSPTAYENGWVVGCLPLWLCSSTRYDYATGKFCFTLQRTLIKMDLDGVDEGEKLECNWWVVFYCVFCE